MIGAFDVLEHIDDDEAVIAEVGKALRPGGGFLMSVPQHPSLWSPQDEHAFHVRRYTAAELRRKVEAAGFEVVRMTSFVSLLLPMMFASRLRMRDRTTDVEFDAIDELRQPRAVNMALEAVMMIERTLIRRGLSFPAGGSLLLVSRKKNQSRGSFMIPFNKPYMTGKELGYISQAHANGHLAGNGCSRRSAAPGWRSGSAATRRC